MSETTTNPATAPPTNDMWDDTTWYRYGFVAGALFIVLQVISFFAPGAPPDRDAAGDEIARYIVDNAGGIKLGAILFGISLIPAVLWIGSIWRSISRLEPAGPRLALVAVIGFVLSGAVATVVQMLFVGPALRPDTLAGSSEFVWTVGYIGFGFLGAATAVHMLALGALVLWKQFLPAWMGYLAFVSAVASTIAIVGVGSEAALWSLFSLIGYLGWLLWVLISSILLFRSTAPAN